MTGFAFKMPKVFPDIFARGSAAGAEERRENMKYIKNGVYLADGKMILNRADAPVRIAKALGIPENEIRDARRGTMAYRILTAHNTAQDRFDLTPGANLKNCGLKIRFDAIASHDITYVGIIQTARASGMKAFPLPYTLTNCHNSLCAVGGTINEDDHVFGLSAAKKYGGDYVPAHIAVIHQYMREMQAKAGGMILGSDSHTRYGALGCLSVGEGGPELVKQLLGRTYDLNYPDVVLIYLKGKPAPGVGPQDVALSLIKEVFAKGLVKNKILEFAGPGIAGLSMDYRNGIDVMTTETTCLSSVWQTDETVAEYYALHGRAGDYQKLAPASIALYDAAVELDLGEIRPMIALPFHPSHAYPIEEFLSAPKDYLREAEKVGETLLPGGKFRLTDKVDEQGNVHVSQGIIAGCAGGMYENIAIAANMLKGKSTGNGAFSLSVYPSSQPVYKCLADHGYLSLLAEAGAVVKTAFCGPCFGAGDVPCNNGLSIRHTTRNFEMREGSKPGQGQLAATCLMDARSIAATAANGGVLTPADKADDFNHRIKRYAFDGGIYDRRVYRGFGKPDEKAELVFGPNIADWPEQPPLKEHLLIKVVSSLHDPVTTTDDLIPSGDTSSYRSNPLKLAEFTLSKKDPGYVSRAKDAATEGKLLLSAGADELHKLLAKNGILLSKLSFGSAVASVKPGDGSAREQAASCQRVLGGAANLAVEYATKRYRSNVVNWGMIPFTVKKNCFEVGDYVLVPDVKEIIVAGGTEFPAKLIRGGKVKDVLLKTDPMTKEERAIVCAGCLINYYKGEQE